MWMERYHFSILPFLLNVVLDHLHGHCVPTVNNKATDRHSPVLGFYPTDLHILRQYIQEREKKALPRWSSQEQPLRESNL